MISETIVILGIPVDNLTMDETVERIFSMIEAYQDDKRARQVATVNVDFVVNTLTWRLGRIRHPELLDILRRADLVTADGMPLVVISKLLGSPLKGRVTGSDLMPRLAERAAQRGKSLYFLGGREEVGKRAAALLRERYPNLLIAGIDSPFVYIEGENLADAEEVDREIIERVNAARPDILLIAFGNPKQEVWFNRNRNRLQVPVSIGIGGTFEFIAGSVRRAPVWMQRTGLEWIFRIIQDPGRLWKRYLVGFFKFGLMVWPAILYYRYKRLWYQLFRIKDALPPEVTEQGAAPARGYPNVVALPGRLDHAALERVSVEADRALAQSSNVILDFGQVSFIDSTGLGFLIRTLRRAEREGCELYLVGITPKVRRFFELNRTWDLFKERKREQLEEVLAELGEGHKLPLFYYVVTHKPEFSVLGLSGRLDAQQMAGLNMAELMSTIGGRNCILNLSQLNFVDSSGLIFFFKIQKLLVNSGKRCVLCALTDNVKQLFRLTKLNLLFRIAPDLASAQQMLEEPA
jgi:N-acetylglucosaminyldiphosphoundecaprenol N-acetyl-beta-D-mannosaminyltransferase